MTRTYLPRASRGRRADAVRPPRRPARRRRRPCVPRRAHRDRTARRSRSTSSTSSCAAARSRRRPCCSARVIAGWIGRSLAVHPTVKLAARFDDEVNVADDVPVHQVKEFAPDLSFGGSASQPGLVALALTDHWSAIREHAITDWRRDRRLLRGDHQRGTRPRAGAARPARPARHVPAHPARPRAAAAAASPGSRCSCSRPGADEVLPVVPRRTGRARPRATWRRCTERFAAAAASVMTVHLCSTVPMGERPVASRRRQLRSGARHRRTCTSTTPRCCPTRPASTRRRR